MTDTKQSLPSLKKVRLTSCAFMGLGQILYLKNYAMGLFYAAVEVLALINLPGMIQKIGGLITLGEQNLSLPVTQRDHSIFMMIDGCWSPSCTGCPSTPPWRNTSWCCAAGSCPARSASTAS